MKGDAYSAHKILHHGPRIEALRRGEQIVPTQVQVILSDLCNQDCSFCSYRLSGNVSNALFNETRKDGTVTHNPNRMIPHAKVEEILADCAAMGVQAIQFTGGGEPLLHPQADQIFALTLNHGLGMALVTNGTRLTEGLCALLTRADWVRVSLDAGDEDTYASVRRTSPATFQRVLDNIRLLVAARNAAKTKLVIGVGFVVTPDNWLGVVDAARLARSAGADNFRISAAFTPQEEHLYEKIHAQAADLCRRAAAIATPDFAVHNMFGDRISDLHQHSPDYGFCGYQQFVTYIGGDLNVYRCCVQSYNPRGLIGSLKEQSFRQLWEGEAKRADFAGFDARGCSRCQFNGKNRIIAYALEQEPLHVAYV